MKYIVEFFSSTRVIMELFLPRLTEVLSTLTPTQLDQGMLLVLITSSIFSKIVAAVPHSLPVI